MYTYDIQTLLSVQQKQLESYCGDYSGNRRKQTKRTMKTSLRKEVLLFSNPQEIASTCKKQWTALLRKQLTS